MGITVFNVVHAWKMGRKIDSQGVVDGDFCVTKLAITPYWYGAHSL